MSTEDGMTSFLESIETNMRRFPEDQLSIYQCLRSVGRHHGVFLGMFNLRARNKDLRIIQVIELSV